MRPDRLKRRNSRSTSPSALVRRAMGGDVDAFNALVGRYRNLVYGYALSALGDSHSAEDAAQEAFLAAFRGIARLRDPRAFTGWLRGIVRHCCNRSMRRRVPGLIDGVSLDEAMDTCPIDIDLPEDVVERSERDDAVLDAVMQLKPEQRDVVLLFYLHERSQRQAAEFLGIPVSVVNNRLHAARGQLMKRMHVMSAQRLKKHALSAGFERKLGTILAVNGPMIDARFAADAAPPIFDSLTVKTNGQATGGWAKVIQRRGRGVIRAAATTPVPDWMPGMKLLSTYEKGHVKPHRDEDLASIVGALAPRPAKPELLETGIKAIDLLCPLSADGSAGIFSAQGVGRMLLVLELYHRLRSAAGSLKLFSISRKADVNMVQDMLTVEEDYPGDVAGQVETFWLVSERATDFEFAGATDLFDSVIYLTPLRAVEQLWPAVDVMHSHSRLLTPEIVGAEHVRVVERVRKTVSDARALVYDLGFYEGLAHQCISLSARRIEEFIRTGVPRLSKPDQRLVGRARRIERYLTQPFHVAQRANKRPGVTVSREQTIKDCRRILDGEMDAIPEDELRNIGAMAGKWSHR